VSASRLVNPALVMSTNCLLSTTLDKFKEALKEQHNGNPIELEL